MSRWWILLATACASASTAPNEVQNEAPADPTLAPLQRVQMCFFGAVNAEDGANPRLAQLCETLPDLVRNDVSGHPAFEIVELDDAIDVMFDVLDQDGDGRITDADRVIIDLMAYSWGGVNSTRIDLHNDERVGHLVDTERPLIGRLVLIDPFIPPADVPLELRGQLERVWVYGHTEAPTWDCSIGAPLAPYIGRPVDCSTTTAPCTNYDLSIDREVGHCSIVDEVGEWALANLRGEDPAPPELIR